MNLGEAKLLINVAWIIMASVALFDGEPDLIDALIIYLSK